MSTISGGIKIFERSKALAQDGAEIVATSGDSSAPRALDRNRVTYWRSVGSNDMTTETLVITFEEAKTIDRILLLDHNWKQFTVKYDLLGSFVNFTNVFGLDGSKSNISETAFADDSAYYEFDEVTTTQIEITITKTQVVDAEKYINQIIPTSELGTLQGYPDVANIELSRNSREKKTLSNKTISMKSEQSFKCDLVFKNYPPSLSNDVDLMFSLWDSEDNFLIWLCGGRRGTTYFRKQLRGWRLRDVFFVQAQASISPDYSKNVYVNPVNFTVKLFETVD